jgi:hypothetical protein
MGDIDAARRAVDALRSLVILVVLLVVAVGPRPAEARDCRDETPLPADVKLIAPGPDIAPEAARSAGAWTGAWKEQDTDTICATLVVSRTTASIAGRGTSETAAGCAATGCTATARRSTSTRSTGGP